MSWREETRTATAVAVGGVVGATGRWCVSTIVIATDGGFPWATFVVNVVGSALIGVAAARLRPDTTAWAVTTTGVLGGFTTMSSFAVELDDLLDEGRGGVALAYLGATLVVGLVVLGVARRLAGNGTPPDRDGLAT
ncbi:FluC/FEX family fluoride channel [Ilumatobacter sp.]|uniref:FluC/FEX family fluoride channel n=1 Tax=Ilumatobacter sp. TaxID=1967498 RepID=UPI003B517CB5